MAQRIHINELVEELMRIFEDDLKTTLNLRSVMRGSIEWMPTPEVPNLVNGIWINVEPDVKFDRITIPNGLMATYSFRIVYVRRILNGEVVNKAKVDDIEVIAEKIWDNYTLPNLSLVNAQVLWCFPTVVETEPQEDAFVAQIASDMVATAFRIECQVRTRRV